jgi:hypothetical protein
LLQTRAVKGFAILSVFFFLFIIPIERIAAREINLVSWIIDYATRIGADKNSTLEQAQEASLQESN